jgi:hypothetical protein
LPTRLPRREAVLSEREGVLSVLPAVLSEQEEVLSVLPPRLSDREEALSVLPTRLSNPDQPESHGNPAPYDKSTAHRK